MNTVTPPRDIVLERLRHIAAEQNRVHVIPSDGRWAVKREGLSRASRVLGDRKKAIELARSLARKDSMEVIVHRKDGSVQRRETSPR